MENLVQRTMLIFVEGPDGSGKTTLCERLVKEKIVDAQAHVTHMAPNQHDWYYYMNQYAQRCGYKVLFDRCFLSDIPYRLWDNGETEGMSMREMLRIMEYNCKIIYCNNINAYEDATIRGESFVRDSQSHKSITDSYNFLMTLLEKFTNIPVFRYDRYNTDFSDVIKFIKEGGN